MSHGITQHDKVQSRVQGWHGLSEVKPDLSLQNSWMNEWDYKSERIMVNGNPTPFAILGVTDVALIEKQPFTVGLPFAIDSFKPISNERLINELTKALEGTGVNLVSCGTVLSRGRQFFSFELPEKFHAASRDFEAFLNIGNGNDKSSPLWVNSSNTATICLNTFNINMADAGKIMEVKKTKYSECKINNLGYVIENALTLQREFCKELDVLAGTPCDEQTAREFFSGYLATNPSAPLTTRAINITEELVKLFKTGAGNNGSDWASTFNAGTDYYSHSSAGENKWKQFVSSEFGAGKTAKQELWEIITHKPKKFEMSKRKSMIEIGKNVLRLTEEAEKAKSNVVETT